MHAVVSYYGIADLTLSYYQWQARFSDVWVCHPSMQSIPVPNTALIWSSPSTRQWPNLLLMIPSVSWR